MKKYLAIVFSLFLAFLGQSILTRYFSSSMSYLDLFLILVIYYSLNKNPVHATLIGTSSGLIQDTFSSGIIGFNSLSKTIIGFALSSINARVMLNHPLAQIAILIVATLLNGIILKGLSLFFGLTYIPQLFPRVIYQAGVNAIVGITIIGIIFFYNKKRQKR